MLYGFLVGPYLKLSVVPLKPYVGALHLPIAIPPNFSMALVKGESLLSIRSKYGIPPQELVHPFLLSKKSFNAKGTPAKGKYSLSNLFSISNAACSASRYFTYVKAFILLFLLLILSSKYFTTSRGVNTLSLTNLPIS